MRVLIRVRTRGRVCIGARFTCRLCIINWLILGFSVTIPSHFRYLRILFRYDIDGDGFVSPEELVQIRVRVGVGFWYEKGPII